jgi:hypothetical protein
MQHAQQDEKEKKVKTDYLTYSLASRELKLSMNATFLNLNIPLLSVTFSILPEQFILIPAST